MLGTEEPSLASPCLTVSQTPGALILALLALTTLLGVVPVLTCGIHSQVSSPGDSALSSS